jgi:hypothetical protein
LSPDNYSLIGIAKAQSVLKEGTITSPVNPTARIAISNATVALQVAIQ